MTAYKKHIIEIEEDGWVSVTMNDGREIGLGDLDEDVEIIDKRK